MRTKNQILKIAFFAAAFLIIQGSCFAQETATPVPAASESAKPKTPPKPSGGKDSQVRTKTPKEIAHDFCEAAESNKKLGRYEEALKDYEAALAKYNEHYPAFIGRASTKFLMIDFQGALLDYNNAIEMMENKSGKHETQAKIKKVLNDLTGENIELEEVARLKPFLAEAYYQRGNVKRFMDDRASACEDLKKSKELGYLQGADALKDVCGE